MSLSTMKWWIRVGCISCILFILCFITSHDCVDVTAQKENYTPDYKVYHNLSMLSTHLKSLEAKYPDYVKLSPHYISRNGESQLFARVSNFTYSQEQNKLIKILFAYGEHAREFFPVESLLYFLANLTSGTNCLKSSCHKSNYGYAFSSWIFSNFDFYVIAMTNPDGRKYIEKTENYCWRGTATGVDLNRNFNWNFGQKGSSSNPKDGEYRGTHAFSEPETKVFQQITQNFTIDAYVSFHSGVRHIYIPFADSSSKRINRHPFNYDLMKTLAKKMSESSPLRRFKYGIASELTGYFADGTSFDYMSGAMKVPFSFAIELWQHSHHRGRSCFDEFNPHSNNLQMELALVHPLYVELLSYLYAWKKNGWQKHLVRFKKDEDHQGQRFPTRKDVMFPSETEQEESFLRSELKFLMGFILFVIVVYVILRQVLILIRKKRVVSLKSLSSTFSMLKSL